MTAQLPRRLTVEPLVEALFELRVREPAVPLHSVLLPLLFSRFSPKDLSGLEQTPLSGIPEATRAKLPESVAEQPALIIRWHGYRILMSSHRLAIAVVAPYPGWGVFRHAILELFRTLLHDGDQLAVGVDRVSTRYVNFFPRRALFDHFDEIANIEFRVADMSFDRESPFFSFQTEAGNIRSVVKLVATASLAGGATRGTIIDVDSMSSADGIGIPKFVANLEAVIDPLRQENKRIFFSTLLPSALERLGPQYDALH